MNTLLRALLALPLLAASLGAQVSFRANVCAGGAVTTRLPGSLLDENVRALGIRAGSPLSLTRGAADDAKARMLADSSAKPVNLAMAVNARQSRDGALEAARLARTCALLVRAA